LDEINKFYKSACKHRPSAGFQSSFLKTAKSTVISKTPD